MQPSNLVLFREMVCILVILSGETMKAELRRDGNSLLFLSDYDADLVQSLKRTVPREARRWDPARKAWLIDPMYGAAVVKLVEDCCGVKMQLPLILNASAPEPRILKVEYLGRTKERLDGERTAFAWVGDGWNVVFPERVLLAWFDSSAPAVSKANTLYGVLGVKNDASLDEIKLAYRRLARQWHPDVCREPDAKEQFIRIQQAYEVLSNEAQRKKYDAGLMLERGLKSTQRPINRDGYRAPLRCGWVLCIGREKLGRFVVDEIVRWEDITDTLGRTMVVSWPLGADRFVVNWV